MKLGMAFCILKQLGYVKRLFFFILSITISCGPSDRGRYSALEDKRDSIGMYYDRSIDQYLSPKERKLSIDRAIELANIPYNDTLLGKLMYQKSSILLQGKDYDSLVLHHEKFLEKDSVIHDMGNKAAQHYLMAYYYNFLKTDYQKAFENYGTAKNYFEVLKDSAWIGKCLLYMGVIQKNQNDFFGSKETLTEAIPYLEGLEDNTDVANSYNLLATNHRKLHNYQDAVTYYMNAIEYSKDSVEAIIYKNNLAATLIDKGALQEAIGILEVIILDPSLQHNNTRYARILDNLSYANWLSGNSGVEDSLWQALIIRREEKDFRGQIASYTHLGEIYMAKRPRFSTALFDSVIRISKRIKMPRAETEALKFMIKLRPDYVKLYERYIFLNDSLYEEELKVKTQFAKYKYDDRLKQESIVRLEKEKAEQALLANKERNKKAMSYLGSLLLLLGLSFVLYYFGQRTKRLKERNKLATLEATLETEAEMSRRLHDDFGAGLNHTMLMVQGDVDKTQILDKLDVLYHQSRNFSREVNEVGTGERFKDELLEMLRYRTPSDANLFITGVKDIEWDGMTPLSQKVLFKVLQELMINMGRHSQANMVTISFQCSQNLLRVKYSDNGIGASPTELNARNGLKNTEKRIQAIDGSIIFESSKNEGFAAIIVIPM